MSRRADMRARGRYYYEQWRAGKMIDEWTSKNLITNEGLAHSIDVTLGGATQNSTWFLGLFNDNYTPTSAETYAAPGYTESTDYAEASRPTWQCGDVSANTLSSQNNKASFTMSTGTTIYGSFLCSNSTKGNDSASGAVLFSAAQFAEGSKALDSADVLKVWYSATYSDDGA